MSSRSAIYKHVKALASGLGMEAPAVWPRGSLDFWTQEKSRFARLARRRAREEAARSQAAHRAGLSASLSQLGRAVETRRVNLLRNVQESIRVEAPNIISFIWGARNQVLPTAEQFKEIVEPYMALNVQYRFTINRTATRMPVTVRLESTMRPYYILMSIFNAIRDNLDEYDQERSNGYLPIQMIGSVDENPRLAGQRATLTDTNCAIQVVQKYLPKGIDGPSRSIRKKVQTINDKYLESGIDSAGLQELANAARMRLIVSDKLGMTWQKFDVQNANGKAREGKLYKNVYMIAHNNHIEEEDEIDSIWHDDVDAAVAQNSKVEVIGSINVLRKSFRDDIDLKDKITVFHDEAHELQALERANPEAKAILSRGMPIAIVTATHIHKLKFTEHEKYPQAFTAGGVGKLKFLAQHQRFATPPKDCKFMQIARDADVSGFYLRTAESSKSNIKFDMNHAFKSFKNSGLFRGFPNLSSCYKVNSPLSEFLGELTDTSQGLLYVDFPRLTLEHVNSHGKIYFEGPGWYPVEIVQTTMAKGSALLPHLLHSQVLFYAQATDSFDVDFSEFTNDQFREFIGRCNQNAPIMKWSTTDPLEFARARYVLGANITNIEINNDEDMRGNSIRVYNVYFTSSKIPWRCPIVSAYVKAHQKYNLFQQYNKIVEHGVIPVYIAIDGIELPSAVYSDLFDMRHWKREPVYVGRCPNRVIAREARSTEFLDGSLEWIPMRLRNRSLGRRQFISGSGGTGKTEYILKLSKESDDRILYLAPTHDACQVLTERGTSMGLNIECMTYHRAYGFGCKPSVKLSAYKKIIIDECSMLNVEDLEKILGATDCTLVLSGDFGQLSPVCGTPIYNHETETYHDIFKDFEIVHLTKNWRQQSDPEFFDICQSLRGRLTRADAKTLINRINTSVRDGATRLWPFAGEIPDLHICGVNTQVDEVNAKHKLEVGAKVIMIKTVNDDQKKVAPNGKIGVLRCMNPITIEWEGGQKARALLPHHSVFKRQKIDNICKLAYAITIHKAQGKTVQGKLVIDPTRIFTQNHLYVALTRATKFDNVYLTEPLTMNVLMKTCRVY